MTAKDLKDWLATIPDDSRILYEVGYRTVRILAVCDYGAQEVDDIELKDRI